MFGVCWCRLGERQGMNGIWEAIRSALNLHHGYDHKALNRIFHYFQKWGTLIKEFYFIRFIYCTGLFLILPFLSFS